VNVVTLSIAGLENRVVGAGALPSPPAPGPAGQDTAGSRQGAGSDDGDRVRLSAASIASAGTGHGLRPSRGVTLAEKKALLDDGSPRQRLSLYG